MYFLCIYIYTKGCSGLKQYMKPVERRIKVWIRSDSFTDYTSVRMCMPEKNKTKSMKRLVRVVYK